jgi:hypothetical protein
MAHKIILMILILGVAIFSGCVDNPSKTVYLLKKTNETITLYSDKTFITSGENAYSGVYRIDGDHYILTFAAFGAVLDLRKDGNNLIDDKKGNVWEKI